MLVPISAKMPMAVRSLMPGMLQSKTTACAQLNAACGETGVSCEAEEGSDVLSGVVSSSFSAAEGGSSGEGGGVKRRIISEVTRSMACSR